MTRKPNHHEQHSDIPRPVDALERLRHALRNGRSDSLSAIVVPTLPRRPFTIGGVN